MLSSGTGTGNGPGTGNGTDTGPSNGTDTGTQTLRQSTPTASQTPKDIVDQQLTEITKLTTEICDFLQSEEKRSWVNGLVNGITINDGRDGSISVSARYFPQTDNSSAHLVLLNGSLVITLLLDDGLYKILLGDFIKGMHSLETASHIRLAVFKDEGQEAQIAVTAINNFDIATVLTDGFAAFGPSENAERRRRWDEFYDYSESAVYELKTWWNFACNIVGLMRWKISVPTEPDAIPPRKIDEGFGYATPRLELIKDRLSLVLNYFRVLERNAERT